jgi:hypothetical protein
MRAARIFSFLILLGVLFSFGRAGLSQTFGSKMPSDCRDRQRVRVSSSGSPVVGDTSKVECTVIYWICGKPFKESQILDNHPGSCDAFADSIEKGLPKEACCD